jgi:hypothetical protein
MVYIGEIFDISVKFFNLGIKKISLFVEYFKKQLNLDS